MNVLAGPTRRLGAASARAFAQLLSIVLFLKVASRWRKALRHLFVRVGLAAALIAWQQRRFGSSSRILTFEQVEKVRPTLVRCASAASSLDPVAEEDETHGKERGS